MKLRLYLALTCLFFVVLSANAQDTLTVMQYNLLYYGNYGTGYCDETVNNTQQKDECIRTILDHVKPDIFTVCEFGASSTLQSDFLRHNLNIDGANYWRSDNIINYASSNIINHIFYDSRKMGLKKHVALHTNPRDTDVYELYMKTPSLAVGDTIKLICIVAHPKAGEEHESSRYTLMSTVMNYIDRYYATDNVLIMGDFNMYRASENGYKILTSTYSNPNALFIDPLANLNGVGEWHSQYQFARYHTQSTRSSSSQCFSSGGLDDRFDFILMADEIAFGFKRMRYASNSYKAIGNDGYHFNQSINQGDNMDVPATIAQALYNCSDHLPVTMKIAVNAHLGINDNEAHDLQATVAPNPASDATWIHFFNPTEGEVQFELYSLQGQLMTKESEYFACGSQQYSLPLAEVKAGFYLLRLSHAKGGSQTLKLVVK